MYHDCVTTKGEGYIFFCRKLGEGIKEFTWEKRIAPALPSVTFCLKSRIKDSHNVLFNNNGSFILHRMLRQIFMLLILPLWI